MKRLTALSISLAVRAFDFVRGWLLRLRGRRTPPSAVVLYYHAVKAHHRRRFAGQMDTLVRSAHAFAASSTEPTDGEGHHVAVTFDDGFKSVLENAVPELVSRGIPFTLFVPSGCLGESPSWVRDFSHPSKNEQVLSAADLRLLASVALATIGSHSVTHRKLVDLDSVAAARELAQSRSDLRDAAGTDVDIFSFPHGAYNEALLDQARRAGYRRVFTIEPSMAEARSDTFTVGRVSVDPDDWAIEFRLKMAGAYRWRHHVHRLKEAVLTPNQGVDASRLVARGSHDCDR